ncbi:hypothetical protein EC957_010994 [Mortierella hygrophila]|uniref:Uncharacterized protein n=1 Tax=Mortierella hygrophila TaxID=979708 RepID=A0A9P6EUL5_9FUNG|nr:hypothetical protein EC957_010994 [Mortierella hygrophila]
MDLRFIGLGSLVAVGKVVGADMAVEIGLIETSTVQAKAGVAERLSIPPKDLTNMDGTSKVLVTYSGASTASSGKTPRASGVGRSAMEFITRLKQMKILESRGQPLMRRVPTQSPMGSGSEGKQEVSGSEGAPKADQKAEVGKQSTTPEKGTTAHDSEIAVVDEESELKIKANKGVELSKEVESSKKVATVDPDLEVHKDRSAIENFVRFNRRSCNARRIAPMTSQDDKCVSFSEKELLVFFQSRPVLNSVLKEFTSALYPSSVALGDLFKWLGENEPGYLIKRFMSDVDPKGLTQQQRGKAGYRGAIKLLSVEEINGHLSCLRPENLADFKLENYNTEGYLFHESVRCDGFRIQLTGFNLKELNSINYRQLPEHQLPPQLISTVGGTDYYLTEVKNVVKTKEDVARLWPNCDDPNEVEILCIDLAKAFVVGGCTLLSDSFITVPHGKMVFGETPSFSLSSSSPSSSALCTASSSPTAPTTTVTQSSLAYYNLSVSQKAVSRPTLKHRRWMGE